MVKVAWKVVNGYGPYAYLQESVKTGDKVMSKHIAYLGKAGIGKDGVAVIPGKNFNAPASGDFPGGRLLIPLVGEEAEAQLKPKPKAFVEFMEQKAKAGTPTNEIVAGLKSMGLKKGKSKGTKIPVAELPEPTGPRIIEVEIEEQHVEHFQVSVPDQVNEATRREQSLVLAYTDHLRGQGHRVTRHRYQLDGSVPNLVCDLFDETDRVLYEAKGDVRRTSVRMGIGQLLDYRRFEPPSISLAILLPRQPAEDLIGLISSVPAATVWRTKDGFASIQLPSGDV